MKQLLDKLITIIKTKDTLVVLAVIIINVLFRLINIDKYDLWYDELFSLFWAQYDKIEEVINVSYWDVAPPGYNIIVHYWIKTFGISAFSIRFLSCLAMSISAGVVYFISKKTFGLKTALIVFILFLTNSNLFYYSQEGRGYACQMLLVSISSLIFLSLLKENKWYLSLFYSILLGSINYYLFYTHFATLFLFVGQTFFAIIYFKNNLLNWYVVSVGVLVYWLTPFLPRVLELIKSNGQNFWLAKPTVDDAIKLAQNYFNNHYFGLFILLLAVIGLFYFIKDYKKLQSKPYATLVYFIFTGVGLIGVAYLESLVLSPLFLTRYILIANIGVIILAGYLISLIPLGKVSFSITLISLFVFGLVTMSFQTYKNHDYKRQMATVKKMNDGNTAIITDTEIAYYYYDIELYKHVYDYKATLATKNLFEVTDTTGLKKIDLTKFNRIVLCTTWQNTNSDLKPTLQKQFPKVTDILYENDNSKIHIYEK